MKPILVTVAVLSVALVGCGDGGQQSGTTVPRITTAAPVPIVDAERASTPTAPMQPGATFPLTGSAGFGATVTLFGVDQNIAQNAPPPASGGHWVGADVETCVKTSPRPFSVSFSDWSAADDSSGRYPATGEFHPEFPTPQYPLTPEVLAEGECIRGWVFFPVSFGVAVNTVKYKQGPLNPAFWSAV
jgi:hypothetical protein